MVKNPLSLLWIGKCTIYEYQNITDPDTYQTTQQLVPVITDEPCRLSQSTISRTFDGLVNVSGGIPNVEQIITLFIRPNLTIKDGSVIEVTQHGVTNRYKGSSIPAVYTNHQEITLELYKDYA